MDERTVNVAIINDSPYFLSLLEDIVKGNGFNVIGKFANGKSALEFINTHDHVDVILLDLEMPDMDGISFMEHVLSRRFIPIIITTSYDESWLQRMAGLGAVDLISISNRGISELNSMIAQKIRLASMMRSRHAGNTGNRRYVHYDGRIVVIGASTGAPSRVADILGSMPKDIRACIIVVQHMPKGFTDTYVSMLARNAGIRVKRADDNDRIVNGTALVAPADYHLIVDHSHVRLEQGPKHAHVRPSANVTMVTAATMYGPRVIGVLLSGMGFDGALGMKVIKINGGFTVAQDEKTSVVFGMARTACMVNAVDLVLPVDKIADAIIRIVNGCIQR